MMELAPYEIQYVRRKVLSRGLNAEPRADMPRLLKSRRGFAGRKPAPQPNEGQAACCTLAT